ncbi:hypothetical protein CWATWH0005_1505 [Crocosphaera watsonii WH 0005]|uniref:Uncharacterized protein n=1 Tax=Crocosphaera watsonii WH 0005 TaxID=423472 RepID=T2ILV7_CROWT|nr:hypothetical protein [Crocosphaera watsonii]CCQ53869.1 hypothetical protein CWATWH0005_1505 [Crocosphaera watsonii WH 0005]
MTNSHSPTLNPINTNQATEVIETLMNLAQQGEIDPWDVQVIDVIDRFLNELGSTNMEITFTNRPLYPDQVKLFYGHLC